MEFGHVGPTVVRVFLPWEGLLAGAMLKSWSDLGGSDIKWT
jgi:hypothetical protein